jgi:hypothetical protein
MESIIGVLKGRDGKEKVEVLLSHTPGNPDQIHFRLLSWGEGVGWYPQKTVELDYRQIGGLQTILKRTEALLRKQGQRVPKLMGKVIPFPLNRSESRKEQQETTALQETGS